MTTEVTGRQREMLSPNVFTEQPEKVRDNRKDELRLGVQPALLAEKGTPRGVTLYYRGVLIVLTEASAITLANSINDALEIEITA